MFVFVLLGIYSSAIASSTFEDPYVVKRWTLSIETIAQWDHFPVDSGLSSIEYINGGEIVLLTDNSLWISVLSDRRSSSWIRVDSELKIDLTSGFSMLVTTQETEYFEFVLVGPSELIEISCSGFVCKKLKAVSFVDNLGNIRDLAFAYEDGLWIVSENYGLSLFINETMYNIAETKTMGVTSVSSVETSLFFQRIGRSIDTRKFVVAVGTMEKLYLFEGNEMDVKKWYHFWVSGMVDSVVTSLEFSQKTTKTKNEEVYVRLYVGNKYCVNQMDLETMLFTRLGGSSGLPYGNITKIVTSSEKVYFGSQKGLIVYHEDKDDWNYFYLDRFLHGEEVISASPVSFGDEDGIIAMTKIGGSYISYKKWSLEEKATFYEDMVSPRHVRFGLVSDCWLKDYGDLTTYELIDNDNDGSWSSVYLISQIYHNLYIMEKQRKTSSSKSETPKQNAWRTFEALELLNDVTGVKGYIARSVLEIDKTPAGSGKWYNSTTYPQLKYKGDTSSDEILCHSLSYVLTYFLLCETQEEKDRVIKIYQNLVDYIISGDFNYIDPETSKHTTWGIWNPEYLNDDDFYIQERGLNSLQLLGFILNLYGILILEGKGSEAGKYWSVYEYLLENNYDWNMVNQKIEAVDQIDHVDDDLGMMALFNLFFALYENQVLKNDSRLDDLRSKLLISLQKSFQYIQKEKSIEFNIIYAIISSKTGAVDDDTQKIIDDAKWTMKNWPQSLINWPVVNNHRIDIQTAVEPSLRYLSQSEGTKVFPYNEISFFRWDSDPYKLIGGSKSDDGHNEYDPGAWLMGYWMMKYYF